jgi:hypothetical protein
MGKVFRERAKVNPYLNQKYVFLKNFFGGKEFDTGSLTSYLKWTGFHQGLPWATDEYMSYDSDWTWDNQYPIYSSSSTPTTTPTPTQTNTPTPTPTRTPTPTPTRTPTPTPISDKTPPVVTITSPKNGGYVTRNTTVTISASATDNKGVSKVNFYVNNTLKCTDQTAAYTCGWRVPTGAGIKYTILVKGYDVVGNNASRSVIVTSR